MDKPYLVFIPGWGADKRCWQKLAPHFEDAFQIQFLELPFAHERAVNGLQAEIELLAESIPFNSVIVAWSLGGMLATQIAKQYPERVQRLVLIATNTRFVATESWPHAMPSQTFNAFCKSFNEQPEKTTKRFNMLQAKGETEQKEILQRLQECSVLKLAKQENAERLLSFLQELDNSEIFFELQQRVLMLFAEYDALVPIKAKQDIDNKISERKLNNIQTEIVFESGHAPHISRASLVAETLTKFLSVGSQEERYKLDKTKVAASFAKASRSYDAAAELQLKVAKTLCSWGAEAGGRVLDLGCGTGYCADILQQREHTQNLIGLDIAFDMLQCARQKFAASKVLSWCNADLESLPIASSSMDTVVSSLAIQWSDDLSLVFSEAERVLKPNGLLLVSSLGPETLSELKRAWSIAEPNYVHVNQFTDANAVMDAAIAANFEVEVFSVDFEILRYQRAIDLMKDLKAIGAHNVNSGSRQGLTGKSVFAAVEDAYSQFRFADGLLPATYEVYYWVFKKR